jgi:hypothetical protein
MKRTILAFTLVSVVVSAFTQSPFEPQLAIPVFFNDLAQKVTNFEKQHSGVSLSGIALMFLDTASTADEIIVTGRDEPVIWQDYVGKSTKVTFVIPDSMMIGRLELLYFDAKCAATVWRHDRLTNEVVHAKGNLLNGPDGLALHFSIDDKTKNGLSGVFDRLNLFLMKLHSRQMRRVAVKPWFNQDSLNLIVGSDSQFNTDNELFWFDQSMRSRLYSLASNAFSKLILFKNNEEQLRDSITGAYQVVHTARPFKSGVEGIQGKVSITLQADDKARYLFFKPDQKYRLFVDYTFYRGNNGPGELSINRFGLRNLGNGDFVEMELYDLINSGFPVIYVDLIRGVVMEDGGPWDVSNVIHAIEDVFGASKMPFE